MQNFTLGKKGKPMFLFALVLLIGNLSFGQCPAVNNSTQDFCALATVGDLAAADQGGGISWYESQTSTDAIPNNELLQDGKTYYAGATDGNTCQGSRQTVVANVTNVGPPTLASGEDEFFTPCERTAGNPSPKTIGDLRNGIEINPVSGYTIEYFLDQYDQNATELPDSYSLTPGTSYFAGYVSTDKSCQSTRLALRYEPIVVDAPAADANQTVCEGTTVGELQAEGTNRWYRTMTSEPPLPNSTVVENGKTYYASKVVPSDGPPCESSDRTAVTVTLQPANYVERTQEFCESIGTGNNFDVPRVKNLDPQGGTFYAEANSTVALDPETELVNGEDYFYRDNGTDCSQDRITVQIIDSPNAGSTTFIDVCSNDAPFDLAQRINDSQLGAPDQDGTFSPALKSGTHIFNPAVDIAQRYTYTVGSTTSCPDDSAFITVNINQAPDLGPDASLTVCSNNIPTYLNDPSQFTNLIPSGVPTNGTFDPTIPELMAQFQSNPTGTFTTTYTVTNSNGCSDSATYSVTITQSPNAGGNGSVIVTREDATINLFDYLTGSPDTGGTFSPGNANGSFDPATGDAGNYTYTVTNGTCSDTATVTVTINEDTCPTVDNTEQSFCESISDTDGNNPHRPTVADLSPAGATWYATATSTDALPSSTILADGTTYYAGNLSGTCPSRTGVDVTIDDSPNAGASSTISVCATGGAVDIVPLIRPSVLGQADPGGSFSPAFASGTTVFDPTVDAAGTYTYRVNSTNGSCPDDTSLIKIIITAPKPANAGPDVTLTFCSTAGMQNLYDSLGAGANPNGTFEGLTNGMFDPSTADTTNSITYTVDDTAPCTTGSDTATYTINILQGPNAGENGSVTLSNTSTDTVNLSSYLGGTPDTGGTFSPGNANGDFTPSEYDLGTYTFTYSVSNDNECTDSATVTVTITGEVICPTVEDTEQNFCESVSDSTGNNPHKPTVAELIPTGTTWYATATSTEALAGNTVLVDGEDYFAGNSNGTCPERAKVVVTIDDSPNAGANTSITVCKDDAPFDLVSKIRASILGAPDTDGTFSPALSSGTHMFDPAVDTSDTYTYKVVSTGSCPDDTTTIKVTVLENQTANAGEDFTTDLCVDGPDVNLYDLLASDVTMTGTFDGYSDGMFSPSTVGAGTYTITYNVGEDLPCVAGSDSSSTFTITVNPVADAPVADAEQSFCLIDNPTVGDIAVTGDNIVWYEDAELTTVADPADALVTGEDYYAVANSGDNACGSAATMVTVTINDAIAPTLKTDGDQFCRQDNPTVQNLIDNLNGTGIQIYASSTGGSPLATSTALVNGTTYYASASDADLGCESTERLAVTAAVNFCGIPEGFSPNGDNLNDRFVIPKIREDYPNFTLEIYNRWGNVVFKGNASTPDWDGVSNQSTTLGNDVVPAGVYFYILNYNDGQTEPVQGKLYLSR